MPVGSLCGKMRGMTNATIRVQRLPWPDVAKALCIILVVERHATLFSADALRDGAMETWLFAITDALRPLRIPLFFVVSGYLAARSVGRPWSRELFEKRIGRNYWLYLLWLAITGVVFAAIPGESLADISSWKWGVVYVLVGLTPLWYLWALAAYFVVAKTARRYPVLLVGVSAALCVLGYTRILPNYGNSTSVLQNLFFFCLAALYPHLVDRVVVGSTWRRAIVAGMLFGAGGVAFAVTPLQRVPLFGPLVALIAVVASLSVIALVAHRAPDWWTYIGRQTLPIYVLHLVVIVPVATVVPPINGPLQPVYVLLLSLAALALSLLAHRLLVGCAPWLFDLPRRLQHERSSEEVTRAPGHN